jgi:hypothetical protein
VGNGKRALQKQNPIRPILNTGSLPSFFILLSVLLYSMGGGQAFAAVIPENRGIDWKPGIPGGIPSRTSVFCNVKTAFGARGDGVTDDSGAIQKAINACPSNQVVYLPEGIYRLNSGLTLSKGIVLRGAGPGKTLLKSYAATHPITVGSGKRGHVETSVSGSPAKDSTQITVGDASNFSVNDYIVIDQRNDNTEVFNTKNEGWLSRNDDFTGWDGSRCLGQITRIRAKSGNTIEIDPPLYHNYSDSLKPEIWKLNPAGVVEYGGIEDLYIELMRDIPDYATIFFINAAYCWIRNIESNKCSSRHVWLDRSFRCEVRDSYFHHAWNYGGGGQGYGVVAGYKATDCRIENNIFYYLRHAMVAQEGPAGCVFGYNYSQGSFYGDSPAWLAPDMMTHGAHPHMILFEGNIVDKIENDDTHGSASFCTFFRNQVIRNSSAHTIADARRAINVERRNYFHNFAGNVIGQADQSWTAFEDNGIRSHSGTYVYNWGYSSDGDTDSDDPNSKSSAWRHGNYDYAGKSIVWNPSNPDRLLPKSLYLSGKPGFYGDFPWPSIGPDLNPMVNILPAKKRFEGLQSIPEVPKNPRVVP